MGPFGKRDRQSERIGSAMPALLPLLAQQGASVSWGAFIWDIVLVVVLIAAAVFVICRSSRRA